MWNEVECLAFCIQVRGAAHNYTNAHRQSPQLIDSTGLTAGSVKMNIKRGRVTWRLIRAVMPSTIPKEFPTYFIALAADREA